MPKSVQNSQYWKDRQENDQERDWRNDAATWIAEYIQSTAHPHRQVILDELRTFEWSYLLEVGCSAGPNLKRIRQEFPEKALFGVDINAPSIEAAKLFLSDGTELKVADLTNLPYVDNHFDVVLLDAVLMYTSPEEIQDALAEISRVTKRSIIIVDRFAPSEDGEITGHVWGRDYTRLLSKLGYVTSMRPLQQTEWPDSPNWQKYGRVFVAHK